MDEHYLLFDPTARLRLRDGPAEPRPVAGPGEIRLIADRMSDSHARALVVTAAYTGMRFGELAALTRTTPTSTGLSGLRTDPPAWGQLA